MANSLVMMQCSAMPEKIKRTSLTQEGIRILRNNSQELPLEVAAGHLTDLCMRMRAAGYNEKFRLEVIKSAMHGFERMVKVEEEGGRPVNRPRSWEEDRCQVQVQKHSRQQNWFRAGGRHVPVFVPHTPGSELAKRMRAKEEENNQGRKTSFLIVELGGSKIHNQLWKPNPWPDPSCARPSCFPCKGEKGGDCTKPGVTYNLYCLRLPGRPGPPGQGGGLPRARQGALDQPGEEERGGLCALAALPAPPPGEGGCGVQDGVHWWAQVAPGPPAQ